MAFIIKDRIKEGTTTTGTGDITLGGAAATFETFQSYMTNGDTTYYAIVHTESGVDEWEVGLGTWNTGNTLTRTTVLAGSNGTSAVDFGSGTKDIFMTYPAAHAALAEDDVTFADITVTGTVDGRDVAADGTKLDTVETNADVTDAVNVAAAGALMKSGGTMTGNLILNADPSAALGAATKQYVDTIASAGIHYHDPVRVESPSALTVTYNNGTNGVGATLTNAGTQEAITIDGVALSLNDRVLIYEQTDQTQNGIYTVTTVGDESTNWVLTRATDADEYAASDPDKFGKGDAFFVKEGTTGAGELYVMNTTGEITFGTTNIVFTQVAETAVYSAGTGLTLTGTTFSIGQDVATTANVEFNQVTAAIIGNVTGNLTGDVTGNADTATALETSRTIQLSGDVTGSASFDGSADVTITATVQDDSHSHIISNVDGLQDALDDKTDTTRTLTAGNGLTGGGDLSANRTFNVGAGTGVTVNADDIAIGQDVATTANVTFNQVTADILRIGDWTGGATYAAVTHKNQTGNEYMMINNDGHTYLSATTGSDVIIRGGNNTSTYEIRVYPDQYATAANSTIITEAGSGLSKSSRTLSHADTSNQASVDNSNGTVIQDVTLDGFGHVTGLASVNLDGRYYTETEADNRFVRADADDVKTGYLEIDHNVSKTVATINATNSSADAYNDRNNTQLLLENSNNAMAFYVGGTTNERQAMIQVGHENVDYAQYTGTLNLNPLGGSVKIGSNTAFHDGYHPNADKWTTARTLTLSGDASGSVSWDGSADATLSVTVANDSHSHSNYITSNADDTGTGGYRTTGTYWEVGYNTGGVAMTTNDGYGNANLTFNHRSGVPDISGNAARIEVNVDSSSNANMNFELKSGVTDGTAVQTTSILNLSESQVTAYKTLYENSNRVFTDGYHPNADKWTTARTLTLSGDASGSVSWDGSANATLNVTVANNSHYHDEAGSIDVEDTRNAGARLPNAYENKRVTAEFTDDLRGAWWSALTVKGWDDGYAPWSLIGYSSTGQDTNLYFRAGHGGNNTWSSQYKVWHEGSDGSGSGLDADLLDGNHASAFVTKSGDTMTGSLNVGAAIGSRSNSISVDSDANSSPIVVQCDTVDNAWGVLPWTGGETYIHGGVYYDDGSWVHRSSNTTNYLLRLNGGTGAGWYASNNSSGSWNVASNVSLWNSSGTWTGAVAKSPTLTLSGDASGSATFTNLGNATLSVTVANDSHNHTGMLTRGTLGGSENLNNYKTTGYYSQQSNSSASGGTNYPVSRAGQLIVYNQDAGNGLQTFQIYSDYSNSNIYTRKYYNGTWTSWATDWNSLTDGAGSGLNADFLDDLHASSFIRSDADDNVSGHTEWQDDKEIRLGSGAEFRMHHSSTGHTYIRNLNHAAGNIYFQSEDLEGTNTNVLHLISNVSRTYVKLYENSGERLRTKSYGIDVFGELRATSNITAYYSDERLKTKVGGIENPLDKVKSLEGFYYVENDVAKEHGFDNEEQQVALSAQAVQEVMPEAVDLAPFDTATDDDGNVYSKSGEEYLTVDYARLVPLLVESIKELEKRVAELEAKQ